MTAGWTAVVLAGGRGRRLGNVEKSMLQLAGRSLLDHVLSSLPADVPVVVVGPPVPVARDVQFVLEEPRYGGPVAGLAAAMAHVHTPVLALLATDMPRAGALVDVLLGAREAADAEAVLPVDDDGRTQYVCAVYVADALRRELAGLPEVAGASLRRLVDGLQVFTPALTPEQAALLRDIDTPEDLRAAETSR